MLCYANTKMQACIVSTLLRCSKYAMPAGASAPLVLIAAPSTRRLLYLAALCQCCNIFSGGYADELSCARVRRLRSRISTRAYNWELKLNEIRGMPTHDALLQLVPPRRGWISVLQARMCRCSSFAVDGTPNDVLGGIISSIRARELLDSV